MYFPTSQKFGMYCYFLFNQYNISNQQKLSTKQCYINSHTSYFAWNVLSLLFWFFSAFYNCLGLGNHKCYCIFNFVISILMYRSGRNWKNRVCEGSGPPAGQICAGIQLWWDLRLPSHGQNLCWIVPGNLYTQTLTSSLWQTVKICVRKITCCCKKKIAVSQ